jgi:hypothetical protein
MRGRFERRYKMKYNKIKIFGIGVAVLMILVAITPSIYGTNDEYSYKNLENTSTLEHLNNGNYTLVTISEGNGTVDIEPDESLYEQDSFVHLTAVADFGWNFSHWYIENEDEYDFTYDTSSDQITLIMVCDISIIAYFYKNTSCHTLIINVNGEGSVDKDPSYATYLNGTNVTLTAIGDTGWKFDFWNHDVNDDYPQKIVCMDDDKTIAATFAMIDYSLTINITGEGYVSKNPDKEIYHYGETVELTAYANQGWKFYKWSGNIESSKNPFSITIDDDKSITAHFFEIKNLSVTLDGCNYSGLEPDYENVRYKVEYTIRNPMAKSFIGDIKLELIPENSRIGPFEWYNYNINLTPTETVSFSYDIKIRCSEEEEIDEERYFLQDDIIMLLYDKSEDNGNGDFNICSEGIIYHADDMGIVNCANPQDDEYIPTYPQVVVFDPFGKNLTTEELNSGIYSLGVIKERLGWKLDSALYRAEIRKGVFDVILLASISGVKIVVDIFSFPTMLSVCSDPDLIGTGACAGSILRFLLALDDLKEIIRREYFDDLKEAVNKTINAANTFFDWLHEEHWKDDIICRGTIEGGKPNSETLKAECVDYGGHDSGKADGYGEYDYNFTTTSKEDYNGYRRLHIRVITASGNNHDNSKSSIPILSGAYSGGTITWNVDLGDGSPCCFPAGTKITMADWSYKNIEDIRPSDQVLSYDIVNCEFTSWRVKLLGNPIHPVYEINNGLLSFTKDHPIRVKKIDGTNGWGAVDVNAAKTYTRLQNNILTMEVGDQIYTSDEEWIEITNMEFKSDPVQTHNIMSFSGMKTYFANDILVFEENPPFPVWIENNFYIRGYIEAWIIALLDLIH